MAELSDDEREDDEPDIREMLARLNEMSGAIGALTRENRGLRQDMDNIRKASPANIADDKKFSSLVATSVTTALDAKADNSLRVKLPCSAAAEAPIQWW